MRPGHQGPSRLERLCRTRSELGREVAETVLREIAHHFGLDEGDLEWLGPLRLPSFPALRGDRRSVLEPWVRTTLCSSSAFSAHRTC
jgi:hypothetical protein